MEPDDKSDAFVVLWKVAEPAVRSAVRRRGCRTADLDDIVQQTSERAWASNRTFESPTHFVSWCCVVALNLRIDLWRKANHEVIGAVPDLADLRDPAELAVTLSDLVAVRRAIALLSHTEREALLSGPIVTGADPSRVKVARHRARTKLRATFERLASTLGVVAVAAVRRVSKALRSTRAGVAFGACAAVALVTSVTVGATHPGSGAPRAATPRNGEPVAAYPASGRNVSGDAFHKPSQAEAKLADRRRQAPLPAVAIPFPGPPGSHEQLRAGPSPSSDETQHVCFATVGMPYRCYYTPFKSIDTLFGGGGS